MIEFHSYDIDLLFHKVSSNHVEDNATTLQMMDSLKLLVKYFNDMKLWHTSVKLEGYALVHMLDTWVKRQADAFWLKNMSNEAIAFWIWVF